MDKLVSPPTDNLYKFLAIFSILVIVACLVVNWNYSGKVSEKMVAYTLQGMEYNAELENFFLNYESVDQYEKATSTVDDVAFAITAEDQTRVRGYHERMLNILRRMSEARPIELERSLFKSEANRTSNMERFKMSEEEYKTWEAKVTDEQLMQEAQKRIQLATQLKTKVNRYYGSVYEMWGLLADEWLLQLAGLILSGFFGLVALWSFFAWYKKHQKYEDMLIKQRALQGEKSRAAEPGTNGRPTIFVAVPQRTARRY